MAMEQIMYRQTGISPLTLQAAWQASPASLNSASWRPSCSDLGCKPHSSLSYSSIGSSVSTWSTSSVACAITAIGFVCGIRRRRATHARRAERRSSRHRASSRCHLTTCSFDVTCAPEVTVPVHTGSNPQLPLLTVAEKECLDAGLRVQKQEIQGGEAWGAVVFDVHAPSSVVLDRLTDFASYPKMIPVVHNVVVQSRSATNDKSFIARCTYQISKFLLGVSVAHTFDADARLLRFELDSSQPCWSLQKASGYWYAEPNADDSERTRVWLYCSLQASSFVPASLLDYAAERALRRATDWLKPHVENLWSERLNFLRKQAVWHGAESRPSGSH